MSISRDRETIGVGLVGYGLAGALLHAPILEALPDYKLVAVASSNQAAATRRDRPVVVPNIDAMLTIDEVELVVVVTPNDSHAAIASAALASGRHVLIDKPMAPTLVECDALIDLARQSGRLLSVYHNRRWDGDFLAATLEVAREQPALYIAAWDRFRPTLSGGWREAGVPGSGLMWDLGPHLIDQAIELFGWPRSMTADVAAQRSGAVVDDYFEIILSYATSRVILTASSMVAAIRPRFALHGPGGSWWTAGLDPMEAVLRGKPSSLADGPPLPMIPAFRARSENDIESQPIPSGDPYAFYRLMAAAIRSEAAVPVDPVAARNVVAIIEAAYAGRELPAPRPLKD